MKVLLIISALCFISFASKAQRSYTVDGNTDINQSISPELRFQYPAFIKGYIVFKDGKETFASLNYNWVMGDMQFINPNGDTLSLANESMIKSITINKDSFFYDKLFVQLLDGNGNIKLAKNEKLKLSDINRKGAYDTRTSGVAVTTYSSVNVSSFNRSLDSKEELTVRTNTTYYVGDAYNHFVPFTKKNLLRKFTNSSHDIEAYLKSTTTDFSKEADLKQLVAFLKTLKN